MAKSREHFDDLKLIGQIAPQNLADLKRLLDEPSQRILRPEGLAVIASKAVSVEVAESVVRQLIQLHSAVKRTGFGPNDLIEIRSNQALDEEWQAADEAMIRKGFENLRQLSGVLSIGLTAKAIELAYDCDNLLQRTRILTDVRPLFSEDAQSIDGAVVAHTLRLRYDSAGTDYELSVALDSSDLHKLIEDCQRALQKEQTAQERLCTPAQVPALDVEDNR